MRAGLGPTSWLEAARPVRCASEGDVSLRLRVALPGGEARAVPADSSASLHLGGRRAREGREVRGAGGGMAGPRPPGARLLQLLALLFPAAPLHCQPGAPVPRKGSGAGGGGPRDHGT